MQSSDRRCRGSGDSGRDGRGALKKDVSISIDALEKLERRGRDERRAAARAKLAEAGAGQGDERAKSATLQFADDTGAMLFRSRMREVLWGKGNTVWTLGECAVRSR